MPPIYLNAPTVLPNQLSGGIQQAGGAIAQALAQMFAQKKQKEQMGMLSGLLQQQGGQTAPDSQAIIQKLFSSGITDPRVMQLGMQGAAALPTPPKPQQVQPTEIEKLQTYFDRLPEGDPKRAQVAALIKKQTASPPRQGSEYSDWSRAWSEANPDKTGLDKAQAWADQKATNKANALPQERVLRIADSIAHGKMAPKSFLSKRGSSLTQIQDAVLSKYPDFDFNKAETNYSYMINPNNLRSIGLVKAAMPRIDDLMEKIDGIKNSIGAPLLDRPLNAVKRAVGGNVPIVDFESLRNAIIVEVNTALSGSSVVSDYRIKLELENMGSDRTPKQLKAAIANLKAALDARMDASKAVPYAWTEVRGEESYGGEESAVSAPAAPVEASGTWEELKKKRGW